ncbi:ABC transporter substrate-binding protein [Natrarchaeobaculum sulfurireducens]|uniref:ABC-type Fe3+ transport system, periplasmic component n=1 Tax=Natrarchaeobaculum sulfurireducens TaxID=2044521 RepID=A0A346PJX3_9EURY|nr:extracellular solute-binding protein [Natrarchaeobaculum sulfurireducens]AXR79818.1 ABC-type Fe3+ transport system, periplasmic component [Natrarchaeobaculum sulfurireducens]
MEERVPTQMFGRRSFLAATGVSAAGLAGLAGCLGDDNGGDNVPIADADPLAEPVDSTAVSWDDLGDLEGEITVYSGRTRDQIDPVFEALEDEYDGFEINRDYDDNDVQVNQILQEGDAVAADLMYSQDPGALNELKDNGVLQQLPQDVVDAVPGSYREPDGHWTGVTGRVRSIQYNSDRWDGGADELPTDIMEYATDDRFEGIISTRPNSGTFRGFIQAMVERKGESETREWVRAMVEDQDIQLFSGGGDQAEAINRGGDDDPIVAFGNSYYAARILNEAPDAPIRTAYTENDAGCLFSIAGVGVLNDVANAELVAEFVRHLLAAEGQEFMMDANGEYPVVEGIDYVGELPDLEEINPPEFDLSDFDMDLQEASELLEQEGMTV